MDNSWPDEHWKHVWTMAVMKAWQDEEFEKALVADAHKALKDTYNYDLPAGVTLRVAEPRDNKQLAEITLMLPAKPAAKDTTTEMFSLLTHRINTFVFC